MNEYYILPPSLSAKCDCKMINGSIRNLLKSFLRGRSALTLECGEKNTFIIGEETLPVLPKDKEYAISVGKSGVAIVGNGYGGLVRGFFVFLMNVETDSAKNELKIPFGQYFSDYKLKNRMIHICVFPENDFYFIKKLIRLAAVCQYTHIVIEFWGMLQYDCLKELAWPNAFTKEQAKELAAEAVNLGLKPIPMFNMYGHATASRVFYGKHVVLDQNPLLYDLFTPDGWAWDITSEKVYQLLADVRSELYAIFGESEYFHIGCDEAYYYTNCDAMRAHFPGYLNRLTNDIVREGRRPMMWMDMLLERNQFPNVYYAFGKDGETDLLLQSLADKTVMVDWQYDIEEAPIRSSLCLKEKAPDKDLLVAPWYKKNNYHACIDTVKENDMSGIMLTTWHTLKHYMPSILDCAKSCGAKTFYWSAMSGEREETATLFRMVGFEGNGYSDSGWSKTQIEI